MLVLACFCLPLFAGLGATDFDNDEAIYSFAVDTMLDSGDWLTPKSAPSETQAFLEKPPLKFWIVAAGIRLGLLPRNEAGMRFWDAVLASLAFLYVLAIGRRLGGWLCGVAAVLILFAHRPLLFEHGVRSNAMEAAVLLCYCGGVYHFLAWRAGEDPRRRRLHLVASSLCFVVGFMTKFVAALFLPMVLAPAVLLTRSGRALLWRDRAGWGLAAAIAVALIAPWFVFQYWQFGAELWSIMFGTHVVTRFTTYLDPTHLQPWSFYVTAGIGHLRASQALLPVAAGLLLLLGAALLGKRRDAFVILAWLVVPVTLISLLSSKIYHYAYPFVPPLALAGGYAVAVLAGAVWALPGRVRPSLSAGGSLPLAWQALRVSAVVLVLLALLPLEAYRRNLSQLTVEHHPLRSARDCLLPLTGGSGKAGGPGTGVWVEDEYLSHVYHYYLRGLGPWLRREQTSDPTVYLHLYSPGHYRPVLLSPSRFDAFRRLVDAGDHVLIERAARKAGLDPSLLAANAARTRMALMPFPGEVLLLPGPFSICGPR